MSSSARTAWAVLVIAGGVVAAIFVPTPVMSCLGPLGVTSIQCARSTGVFPAVGYGAPVLMAAVIAGSIVAVPAFLERWREAFAAAVLGALASAVLYVALRPTSWSGPTSTGEVITLDLPIDPTALLTASLGGAAAGLVVLWAALRARLDRRHPHDDLRS